MVCNADLKQTNRQLTVDIPFTKCVPFTVEKLSTANTRNAFLFEKSKQFFELVENKMLQVFFSESPIESPFHLLHEHEFSVEMHTVAQIHPVYSVFFSSPSSCPRRLALCVTEWKIFIMLVHILHSASSIVKGCFHCLNESMLCVQIGYISKIN